MIKPEYLIRDTIHIDGCNLDVTHLKDNNHIVLHQELGDGNHHVIVLDYDDADKMIKAISAFILEGQK